MESTILKDLGLYWGNGKENGNYYSIVGSIWALYRGNGKENGNYRDYRGYIGVLYYILGLY